MAHVPRRSSRYGIESLAEARSVFRSRPVDFDPDTADTIIDMIANGESLNEICADRDAPLPATFLRWCRDEKQLHERYVQALEMNADLAFDEATSYAFDTDTMRAGVRSRAMMTRAERMLPDKYGPRATIRTKPVEEDSAGIDYSGEVRRRIQAMADRMSRAAADVPSEGEGTPE